MLSESKQRRIGAILSYISIFFSIAISIIYTPILTSKLGQAEYGIFSFANSTIGYLQILDLGLGSTIIIFVSKAIKNREVDKEKKLYGMFLTIYIIMAVIAFIFGIVLANNVAILFNKETTNQQLELAKYMFYLLALNLAITFPGSVFNNIIMAHEKFVYAKSLSIISTLLKPILVIPGLLLGQRSLFVVLTITAINLFVILSNIYFCIKVIRIKFIFNSWDKLLLKSIFSFSVWVALQEIIDKVNWSLDNFIIGKISGVVAVSVYAVAAHINRLYISFSTAISGVLVPKISKIAEEKENSNQRFTDIMTNTGRIQLYIVGLILSGFIIFGRNFIILWVGNDYEEAYIIAIALMFPMTLSLIQNTGGAILKAKNKHKFMTLVYLFIAVVNVIISIPLVKLYGGIGAAFGTGISLFLGNWIIKNIYYQKIIKLDIIYFFKKILNIFIIQIFLTVIAYFIVIRLNINSWLYLLCGIISHVIIYGLIMYLTLGEYEKNIINDFKNKFFMRKSH